MHQKSKVAVANEHENKAKLLQLMKLTSQHNYSPFANTLENKENVYEN